MNQMTRSKICVHCSMFFQWPNKEHSSKHTNKQKSDRIFQNIWASLINFTIWDLYKLWKALGINFVENYECFVNFVVSTNRILIQYFIYWCFENIYKDRIVSNNRKCNSHKLKWICVIGYHFIVDCQHD